MGRGMAYLATGVAVVSAITVFLFLVERDHSLLLAAGSDAARTATQEATAQPVAVSTDTQPSADSITRVTVPTGTAEAQPAPVAASPNPIAKPSGAMVVDPELVIARSHAELVPLQKRGLRHYVEFTLARSRRLQHVGPIAVGIWKVDSRHKLYDISLLADGHRVDRKHVNLNSPVWISSDRYSRPLQFVVYGIERDRLSGYLSSPNNPR